MTKKIFKWELSIKKLQIYISESHKDCVILKVQYLLCFTKMCEVGKIFDKNSFILGTKIIVLKNSVEGWKKKQFPWEHQFFFVANILRAS